MRFGSRFRWRRFSLAGVGVLLLLLLLLALLLLLLLLTLVRRVVFMALGRRLELELGIHFAQTARVG